MTKSAGSFYWRNPWWKTSSFVQCTSLCPEVLLWNGAQRNSAAQVSLGIFQKYQHNHIKGHHIEWLLLLKLLKKSEKAQTSLEKINIQFLHYALPSEREEPGNFLKRSKTGGLEIFNFKEGTLVKEKSSKFKDSGGYTFLPSSSSKI